MSDPDLPEKFDITASDLKPQALCRDLEPSALVELTRSFAAPLPAPARPPRKDPA